MIKAPVMMTRVFAAFLSLFDSTDSRWEITWFTLIPEVVEDDLSSDIMITSVGCWDLCEEDDSCWGAKVTAVVFVTELWLDVGLFGVGPLLSTVFELLFFGPLDEEDWLSSPWLTSGWPCSWFCWFDWSPVTWTWTTCAVAEVVVVVVPPLFMVGGDLGVLLATRTLAVLEIPAGGSCVVPLPAGVPVNRCPGLWRIVFRATCENFR